MENATPSRPSHNASPAGSSPSSSKDEQELFHLSQGTSPGDAAEPSTSSSSAPSPSSPTSTWNMRKPLSPEDVILRPLSTGVLPEPKKDAALFLPADAERTWYLGFIKPWKNFNIEAIQYWHTKRCRDAFEAIKTHPMVPPRSTDRDVKPDSHGSEILHAQFQREALEMMHNVYNRLLDLTDLQDTDLPNQVFLGPVDDEDLGNDERAWTPSFVVKAARDGNDEGPRVLGQVEYLGGKLGALSWAVKEVARNSWGSLRCVLGEIAQYMLQSSTRHAFLVAADEIMFLRFELIEKVEYNTHDGRDAVDLFVEPWLSYSAPIKFSEVLDEKANKVPVKLALMYLLHCGMQKDWEMQAEIGNSMKYAAKTKAGERYLPKLDWLIM
ncbi:hypothetical protein BDU57DRAFT_454188 [Ampelomyces quisqualis]|uniref:Uncharacterized protein n=1 Tax=Ampelomyces quisqualis TaxID=50730 RepID=A0A6A5QF77_AMPQU|nr:hypothetical protein BDU57DRAFT_454188 [Ampelomyces quisqualis]